MIPIRDDAPRLTVPFVTWTLIAINVAVFSYQFSLWFGAAREEQAFLAAYSLVPARVESALIGNVPLLPSLLPVLTSMFLHGGWMHLIGNVWFLSIFGDNVEDELGHVVFLLFYLACGVLAAIAQFLSDPDSSIPMVGASGAIAGVMGAYLVRFPRARVTVWLPIFIFFGPTFALPAFLMLTYWLGIQVVSGWGAAGQGGVAWWAHIGGFLAGVGLVLLRRRRRVWTRTWRS